MRRAFSPPRTEEALKQFDMLQQGGLGLRLLLTFLPAGASLADARRLHQRLRQQSRRPCRILDEALGISRD